MLMSPFEPEANSQAVKPLMRMPIPATTITVVPATGAGSRKRCTASTMMPPVATSSTTALNRAARIEEPRRP